MAKKKKLKGLKRIDRIINEFLKQFGLNAAVSDTFQYDSSTLTVEYTFVVNPNAANYLIPYAKHLNKNVEADVFLLSFMHEIGHHFTEFNFSNAEWTKAESAKAHIDKAYEKDLSKEKKWNNVYFNLPVEKAATEWALNYMEKHSEEVAEFWGELQPAIMRFYRKNDIH